MMKEKVYVTREAEEIMYCTRADFYNEWEKLWDVMMITFSGEGIVWDEEEQQHIPVTIFWRVRDEWDPDNDYDTACDWDQFWIVGPDGNLLGTDAHYELVRR